MYLTEENIERALKLYTETHIRYQATTGKEIPEAGQVTVLALKEALSQRVDPECVNCKSLKTQLGKFSTKLLLQSMQLAENKYTISCLKRKLRELEEPK